MQLHGPSTQSSELAHSLARPSFPSESNDPSAVTVSASAPKKGKMPTRFTESEAAI